MTQSRDTIEMVRRAVARNQRDEARSVNRRLSWAIWIMVAVSLVMVGLIIATAVSMLLRSSAQDLMRIGAADPARAVEAASEAAACRSDDLAGVDLQEVGRSIGTSGGKVAGRMGVFLAALRQVESGGNDQAVGDQGRSRGPFQIMVGYWTDGGGRKSDYMRDVWRADKSAAVMIGYWRRYCPAALAAGDWQTLARVHNGGPAGTKNRATVAYWQRVAKAMKRLSDVRPVMIEQADREVIHSPGGLIPRA
jgi:hypothetical protein